VIGARGLHWVSRLHLLMGIGSYLTSPLWLIFLLLGVLISLQARFVRPAYFGAGKSLFPQWPHVDPVRAKFVFIGTMAVLLAPKLLAFLLLLRDGPLRRGCGGAVRALLSVLIETLIGGLLAPIAMLLQTGAVVGIVAGRDSGWNAQRRDDGGIPLRQIWQRYGRIMLFGLVLAAAAYAVAVPLFLWMLPVLVGLALAVPLAAGTASRRAGQALRRMGLLQITEEVRPPAVLTTAAALLREDPVTEGIGRLRADPALLRQHRAMLAPSPDRKAPVDVPLVVGLAKLARADSLPEALQSLTSSEKAAILGCAEGLDRLARLSPG
jgi:membrane glycosyltransferase